MDSAATARATAVWAGPNICTACFAPLMVTLLKSTVSGLHGRLGVTTASSVVKPSLLFESAFTKAAPATPLLLPMMRSTWAISFPSPTSDSPIKKSAAMSASVCVLKNERICCHIVCSTDRENWAQERRARRGISLHAVPPGRVARGS